MANSKPLTACLPAESFLQRRGAELAIQLLQDCEGDFEVSERCQFTAPVNCNQAQRDIAKEYFDRAVAGGPEVLEGFTLILSDVIACLGEGGVPDSNTYRNRRAYLERLARDKARDEALEAAHA